MLYYCTFLHPYRSSVLPPFQVRFKSVPYIGRYKPHRTEKKKRISLGETDTQMKQTIDWDEIVMLKSLNPVDNVMLKGKRPVVSEKDYS